MLDLNLETWTRLAREDTSGRDLLEFVQGRRGNFFDPASYLRERGAWRIISARVEALALDSRRYLEQDERSPELERLLELQTERVLSDDPELVGLSLVFPEQVLHGLALARALHRRSPGLGIVLGGASLSALVAEELLLACPEVDAVLCGEGEPGAGMIFAGAARDSIPGLVHRSSAGPRRNPSAARISLDALPAPDFSGLPLGDAWSPSPVLPALYSRGCRWRRCGFCVHNASFAAYRHKRRERFVDELASEASLHGVRHLYLADQYLDAASLAGLSEAIEARGLDLRFHAMGRPTAHYTRACLETCRRGGCRWISWGVESASQRLLDLCEKGTRIEEVARVIGDSFAAGISNLLMLIFGLPTSTDEDLAATLRFLEDCHPWTDAIASSGFVLFAGSPFASRATELGLRDLDARELLHTLAGKVVHGTRLDYHETGSDGLPRPARGRIELAAWEQRRRWLGELPFVSELCAEHYLLYASHAG